MIDKLLTEHHSDFLSFKGGCTGSYESTLVKMLHCWKSHAAFFFFFFFFLILLLLFYAGFFVCCCFYVVIVVFKTLNGELISDS